MNKHNNPALTKSCANCGLQKPLSAFLEMSSKEGAIYGNICSSCRKTALEEMAKRKKTEAEGSSTSESGQKIDSKVKVQMAVDNREIIERTSEEYHAERKEDEIVSDQIQESKFKTEQGEKKHRQDILSKRSFLGADAKRTAEQIKAAQARSEVVHGNEQAGKQAAQRKETRVQQEIDLTVTQHGNQTGQRKYTENRPLMDFLTRIASAPMSKKVDQTKHTSVSKQTDFYSKAKTGQQKEPSPAKEAAVEFIEKNWRPGGKR